MSGDTARASEVAASSDPPAARAIRVWHDAGVRYMVVEHFTRGAPPVYERARERGRMLPEGLRFIDSWVIAGELDRCFQLMETDDPSLFEAWTARWSDLVTFEILPVISSAEAAEQARAAPIDAAPPP